MIKEHTIYQKSNKTNRRSHTYKHIYPKNIASLETTEKYMLHSGRSEGEGIRPNK